MALSWGITEITLVCVTSIIFVLYKAVIEPLYHWRRERIPYERAVPFLGSMSDVAFVKRSIGEAYAHIYTNNSGWRYVGFHKFNQPAILLRDPEIIESVIVKDFEHFPSNEIKGDVNLDPMFGRHLFALSGERWKNLRHTLYPAFTNEKLKEVFPLVLEVCDILDAHVSGKIADGIDGNYDVELRELCNNFTTSTLSSCALGVLRDAINFPDDDLRRMGRKLLEPSFKKVASNLIFLQIPWLAKLLGIPFVPREVTEYFRKSVYEEVVRREREGLTRNDFMQMFINLWKEGKLQFRDNSDKKSNDDSDKERTEPLLKEEEKTNSSEGGIYPRLLQREKTLPSHADISLLDDITAVALAFFSDGSVTTATVISFALYEMAQNIHVQERLRKEVNAALKCHGGKVNFEALQDMAYMDMVIFEVLRLYPPAPFMTRSCSKSYRLPNPEVNSVGDGLWIEEGTPVIVPTYGIHRDPEYYPNPEKFDPERFAQEAKSERTHFTYYAYGEGPRICIGVKFGFLQAKAAIATLLTKVKLLPHKNSISPISFDPRYFVTVSKDGLWIRINNINNKT